MHHADIEKNYHYYYFSNKGNLMKMENLNFTNLKSISLKRIKHLEILISSSLLVKIGFRLQNLHALVTYAIIGIFLKFTDIYRNKE